MDDKKVKVGIIGCGARGTFCFGKLISSRSDAEVTALCDPVMGNMRYCLEQIKGAQRLYTSIPDMIEAECLDAAIITSMDCCHEENAVQAMKGGLDVLIDKPLSTTVKGCKNIIETMETTGRTAMIGFNLRHHAVLLRLKQIIKEGILGKIFLIENREFYNGGRSYMARWNRKYAKSGGLWISKGSHDFDVFNWLLDFPKPVNVSAFAAVNVLNPEGIPFDVKAGSKVGPVCWKCEYKTVCPDYYDRPWTKSMLENSWNGEELCLYTSEKDTHDNGIAMVEYENGAKASHLECFVTSQTDRLYTVVGDRGQAEVSLHGRRITLRKRWSSECETVEIPEVEGGHGGADPELVNAFINVIRGRGNNHSTLEQGMWATAIGQAAEISRRESRTVRVDELFNSN